MKIPSGTFTESDGDLGIDIFRRIDARTVWSLSFHSFTLLRANWAAGDLMTSLRLLIKRQIGVHSFRGHFAMTARDGYTSF